MVKNYFPKTTYRVADEVKNSLRVLMNQRKLSARRILRQQAKHLPAYLTVGIARTLILFARRTASLLSSQQKIHDRLESLRLRAHRRFSTIQSELRPARSSFNFSRRDPQSKLPTISVVFDTRGLSFPEIEEGVKNVASQTYQGIELLMLVHQGDRELAAQIAETGPEQLSAKEIKLITHQYRTPRKIRDLGVSLAKGEALYFLDPRIVILPNFFLTMSSALTGGPKARPAEFAYSDLLVGGRVCSLREHDFGLLLDAEVKENRIRLGNAAALFWRDRSSTPSVLAPENKTGGAWNRINESKFAVELTVIHVSEPLAYFAQEKLLVDGLGSLSPAPPILPFTPETTLSPLPRPNQKLFKKNRKHPAGVDQVSQVIFFIPWLLKTGGAELFFQVLAKLFRQAGIEVAFVLTHPESTAFWEGKLKMMNVTPHVYDISALPSTNAVDSLLTELGFSAGKTICLNAGSSWHFDHVSRMRNWTATTRAHHYALLFNSGGHSANFLINRREFSGAITVYRALELALKIVHPGVKALTIPVGTLAAGEVPLARRPDDGTGPIVGWLGRLSDEKNPMWFVQIASEFRHRGRFIMGGDGPLASDISQRVSTIQNFDFLGYVEDSEEFLQQLDCLVLTSSIEGVSNVAVEALAVGIPVISPDVGGMSELIAPGENGFLYPANQPAVAAEILNSLFDDDRVLLKAVTEKIGSSPVSKHLTQESMIISYLEFFSSLVEKRS